jgi:hypothetical protein
MLELLCGYNNGEREWSFKFGAETEVPDLYKEYITDHNLTEEMMAGEVPGMKKNKNKNKPDSSSVNLDELSDFECKLCIIDHDKTSNFKEEGRATWCAERQLYYGIKCGNNICNKTFVPKGTGDDVFKPTSKKPMYTCIGASKGCTFAYCYDCYVKLLVES